MGRDLHPTNLRFFRVKMHEHDRVMETISLPNPDEYIFRIKRPGSFPDVIVHLTDAYHYGTVDFDSRPKEISRGSFVLMGMPHADYDEDLVDVMRKRGIGLGGIGKFMGALNSENIWEYETKQEKQERLQRQRRKS